MEAAAVISTLRSRGARLLVTDRGRLGVEPRSVLTEELRSAIRARREGILEILRLEGAFADSPAARLERAWTAALARARRGFASVGNSPGPELLAAAAKLELDLADPEAVLPIGTTADLLRDLLAAVYAGRLQAQLLESGMVRIHCAAGARLSGKGEP